MITFKVVESFEKHTKKRTYKELENALHLRQLQIRSLLAITQAINDNVSAEGLFDMYKNFLAWEMEVDKMALFIEKGGQWQSVVTIHVDFNIDQPELINSILKHKRLYTVRNEDPRIMREFDILIPVYHKDMPIAFTLLGGFKDEKEIYDKIQFITTITNIISVAIENKKLFKERLQQQLLQKEIELAEEVQHMMIPESLPKEDRFNMSSIYMPHFNVGGDYFDYIPIDKDRFVFCIADISGKGVAAAILMANFQAILKVVIRKSIRLEEVVEELNKEVFDITKSDKFITFFIGLIDLKKQQIEYVNAGHNPPVLIENNEVHYLEEGTTVLGAIDELPPIGSGVYHYQKACHIMAFTDGLTDLTNEEGAYFDQDHIENFFKSNYMYNSRTLKKQLKKRLNEFRGSKTFPDDIAVLSCQLTPVFSSKPLMS